MKQTFATLALAMGISLASHAHSGSAGHDGSSGLVPHVHMSVAEALVLLAAGALVFALWKGVKMLRSRHDPR